MSKVLTGGKISGHACPGIPKPSFNPIRATRRKGLRHKPPGGMAIRAFRLSRPGPGARGAFPGHPAAAPEKIQNGAPR